MPTQTTRNYSIRLATVDTNPDLLPLSNRQRINPWLVIRNRHTAMLANQIIDRATRNTRKRSRFPNRCPPTQS